MTSAAPERLIRGTLADLRTLMSRPVGLRRGSAYRVKPANPAAGGGFTYTVGAGYWERIAALTFTLATSAAAPDRSAVLNYLDGDGSLVNQTLMIPLLGPSQTWIASADLSGSSGQPGAAGLSATGTAGSPAAGATIASIAAPAGDFTVSWLISLGGTVAAADTNNFGVFVGAVQVAQSVNPGSSFTSIAQQPVNIQVPPGGATVAIKAIGAGTAGSNYNAELTLGWTANNTSYPELPDLILKPLDQAQIAVAGIQAADQLSAIVLTTERYPSNWADGSLEQDLEQLLEG